MGETNAPCIFCRIVAGDIPAYTLFESEQVLAFLDVGPLAPGHALVIPKTHYEKLDEMPHELAGACMSVMPRLARAVRDALGAGDGFAYNVLQNNGRAAHQAVGHVHFHLIPKPNAKQGLGIEWPAGELNEEQAKQLQSAISDAMSGER